MKTQGDAGYLISIVSSMASALAQRRHSGVEVAFLRAIDIAAVKGLPFAELRLSRYEAWQRASNFAALIHQRRDGTEVLVEQPDGTRAVYRKVGTEPPEPPVGA